MITWVKVEFDRYESAERKIVSVSRCQGFCLSTDTKPVRGIANGSLLDEMDTGIRCFFDEDNLQWRKWGGSTAFIDDGCLLMKDAVIENDVLNASDWRVENGFIAFGLNGRSDVQNGLLEAPFTSVAGSTLAMAGAIMMDDLLVV